MEQPGALLLGLSVALGILVFLSMRSGAEAAMQVPAAPQAAVWTPGPDDLPVPFGYKCRWLAIQGASPEAVMKALPLHDVHPAGWPEGIDAAYRGDCFVSPTIDGWVLVVSTDLPDSGDSRHPNLLVPYVKALSKKLGCVVQYFGTHRVVEYHAWVWADRGQVRRAYGFIGEQGLTLMNEGEPTPEERTLDLVFADDPFLNLKDEDDLKTPDEEDVMTIAGAWSLNPTTLGEAGVRVGTGFLGHL